MLDLKQKPYYVIVVQKLRTDRVNVAITVSSTWRWFLKGPWTHLFSFQQTTLKGYVSLQNTGLLKTHMLHPKPLHNLKILVCCGVSRQQNFTHFFFEECKYRYLSTDQLTICKPLHKLVPSSNKMEGLVIPRSRPLF